MCCYWSEIVCRSQLVRPGMCCTQQGGFSSLAKTLVKLALALGGQLNKWHGPESAGLPLPCHSIQGDTVHPTCFSRHLTPLTPTKRLEKKVSDASRIHQDHLAVHLDHIFKLGQILQSILTIFNYHRKVYNSLYFPLSYAIKRLDVTNSQRHTSCRSFRVGITKKPDHDKSIPSDGGVHISISY